MKKVALRHAFHGHSGRSYITLDGKEFAAVDVSYRINYRTQLGKDFGEVLSKLAFLRKEKGDVDVVLKECRLAPTNNGGIDYEKTERPLRNLVEFLHNDETLEAYLA